MQNLVRINLKEFRISDTRDSTNPTHNEPSAITNDDFVNILDDIMDHPMHDGNINYNQEFVDPGVKWCERKIGDLNLFDIGSEHVRQRVPSVSHMDVDSISRNQLDSKTKMIDSDQSMDIIDTESNISRETDELIGETISLDNDVDMDLELEENTVKKVLKALISPTELGVSMANRGGIDTSKPFGSSLENPDDDNIANKKEMNSGGDEAPSTSLGTENNSKCEEQLNADTREEEQQNILAELESVGSPASKVLEPSKQNSVKAYSGELPYKFEINNHYYNYIYPGGETKSQENEQQRNFKSNTYYGSLQHLPDPWSKHSHPHSKFLYMFTSYLQLFLNTLVYMALGSFLLMFLKAFYHDLQSSWNQELLKLHYESSVCKFQHLINKCSSQQSPALQEQCLQWKQCMDRDNDNVYIGRSVSIARIVGSMINGIIEPIGWKAVVIAVTASYVWIFGLNLLFGFVRAKTYYQKPQPVLPPNVSGRVKLLQGRDEAVDMDLNTYADEECSLGAQNKYITYGAQDN